MSRFPIAAALCAGLAAPASAVNVNFVGAVINACVLTVSTPGVLAVSSNGTSLSSAEVGGVKAIMLVSATGTNPQIAFSAPTLSGPAASTSGATTMIGYSSLGGVLRGLAPGASTYTATRLLDTLTIDGSATNPDGFVSGTYTLTSTVTCQQ